MGTDTKTSVLYEMRCPNCDYHYFLRDPAPESELCPECGHFDKLDTFIVSEARVCPFKPGSFCYKNGKSCDEMDCEVWRGK